MTAAVEHESRTEGDDVVKVIHGSLKGLLREVKERKVDAVRVMAFMQADVATSANGLPRYTAWVVV